MQRESQEMIRRLLLLAVSLVSVNASAGVSVRTVDFLERIGTGVNGAGPLLIQVDEPRNRLVAANTLSSSLSVIDCATGSVVNIPLEGRAYQHLKSEAMMICPFSGNVYLVGRNCFHIVSPDDGSSKTVPTKVQFESIAVDPATGNVFLAGRESAELGFFDRSSGKLSMLDWLDTREDLVNLNATPPPPIRKVIPDVEAGWIVAVDGISPALYIFDAADGALLRSRALPLAAGGRWHLAGYDGAGRNLYIVTETDKRVVAEAARIDIEGDRDVIVPLPGYTEGVGITYNPARGEVYIPYDNAPTVHVAWFDGGGGLDEIMVPAYGNDAGALDIEGGILYIASWAHGEIDVINLEERRLVKRIESLGIIPHMFNIAFNPRENKVYFPKGASAVNGTFGAAISVLDPAGEKVEKIYTGWAPVDLIEMSERGSFLVFNSEDGFAEVFPDGRYETHRLPRDYPVEAVASPEGDVYLSYGPHQSYWPVVYIWGARDGILTIDSETLGFYDRRIPRQAQRSVLDRNGVLYFTQNNWGKEEQFLGVLADQVRLFEAGERLRLGDEVEREITQRILRYDGEKHLLFLVRLGEKDTDPSVLQVIDPDSSRVLHRIETGVTATDLAFDEENIYVASFDSKSVTVIDRGDYSTREADAGKNPLKLCRCGRDIFSIDHTGNRLFRINGKKRSWKMPFDGFPDNIFAWGEKIVITSHSGGELYIGRFDPAGGKFTTLHRMKYPYGDTRFDSGNVSFYVRGQFGDALFEITRGKTDKEGRFWLTDFLSGRLIILERG